MVAWLIAVALLLAGCASGSGPESEETTVIQTAPAPMFIHPAPGGLGPRPRR